MLTPQMPTPVTNRYAIAPSSTSVPANVTANAASHGQRTGRLSTASAILSLMLA